MNNQKKETELKCLNSAIQNCLSQKGDSRRIGMLMSGVDVERKSEERPDFKRYIAPASKKKTKYQSMGRIHQNNTLSYFNKWQEY